MQTLAEHIAARRAKGIGLKTAVMEHAVMRRGLPYQRLNRYLILVEPAGGVPIPFYNMLGPSISTPGCYLADRKQDSRRLLAEAGVTVPATELFTRRQQRTAWRYAQGLSGGAVIKPTRLSRGRGITTGIHTEQEFDAAWERAFEAYGGRSRNSQVIIEQHVTGEDFRCFVVGGELISATQRRRPQVIGDGRSTVAELIAQKNTVRAAHPTLNTYPIPTDPEQLDLLGEAGLTLEDVPSDGETVVLRRTSNLSGGGDSVDVTDEIHPGFREVAVRSVAAIPGMAYMGADLIAPSVAVAPTEENHVVTEVESSPGPLTDFPIEGTPRDMAGPILEYYLKLQQ